jgi:23S rRNA pseudouridine1911/1915/1917 synthase
MAISHFEVLEYLDGATLVKVRILTGRTHQIRVHMAFTGHPLLGDSTYGGRKTKLGSGHYLHAWRLSLAHPGTGKKMEWRAELPPAFKNAITELGSKLTELPL